MARTAKPFCVNEARISLAAEHPGSNPGINQEWATSFYCEAEATMQSGIEITGPNSAKDGTVGNSNPARYRTSGTYTASRAIPRELLGGRPRVAPPDQQSTGAAPVCSASPLIKQRLGSPTSAFRARHRVLYNCLHSCNAFKFCTACITCIAFIAFVPAFFFN
jgi:hypothetical protein